MVALQAWLARLAWLWKSRFHFHGGLLVQESHANAHAQLSELASSHASVELSSVNMYQRCTLRV
jgi:hypothetical protein